MGKPVKRIMILLICLMPGAGQALDWDGLWLNDDQRAVGRMEREDYAAAARLFDDKRWRAAAWYRAGEYRRAAEAWAELDDTDAHYNRGNALARLGDVQGAVSAYETVLQREPGHADARHNLSVIRAVTQQAEESGTPERPAPQAGADPQRSREERSAGEQGEGRGPEKPGDARPLDDAQPSSPRDEYDTQTGTSPDRGVGSRRGAASRKQAKDRGPESEAASGMGKPGASVQQAAMDQSLRRIPDDPGGLLKRKFLYEYRRRQRGDAEPNEPW